MSETPDIASSTADYATRFSGAVGAYLLEAQNRTVLRLLDPWRGGDVLDVGGGHAQLCAPLLDAGCRVTVLGSAEACFERPRQLVGNRVQCVAGNLLDPPFPDRSFDVVVAIRMLAHIDDTASFLHGLARVARHAVIVDYPDVLSVNMLTPLLYGLKKKLEGNTRTYRLFRRREIVAGLARHGFGHARSLGQFFWPLALHRTLGKPGLSRALEAVPSALHLDRVFGTPMTLRVCRL